MRLIHSLAAGIALLCSLSAIASADEARTAPVKFKPGTDGAELKGTVKGRDSILYTLNAKEGQFLKVDLTSDNLSTNFTVYIPGRSLGDEALYASAMGDPTYTGQLYKTGDHTIAVFLNRNAARRGDSSNFTLSVRITDGPPEETGAPKESGKFSKTVSYDKISFTVTSPEKKEENQFTIQSAGLTEANDSFPVDIKGKVIDVICDDIDGDNSPEVAVIIEGSDGKRSAQIFSSYHRKSFGMVNFQDVTEEAKLTGYQGGDEFQFVESNFVRRFPLHEGGAKSGKFRQFQFKLEDGEASKQLKLSRTTEF